MCASAAAVKVSDSPAPAVPVPAGRASDAGVGVAEARMMLSSGPLLLSREENSRSSSVSPASTKLYYPSPATSAVTSYSIQLNFLTRV